MKPSVIKWADQLKYQVPKPVRWRHLTKEENQAVKLKAYREKASGRIQESADDLRGLLRLRDS